MNIINTQVIVLGAGETAYAAAFRCTDLGLDVVLVSNETSIIDADPHSSLTITHGCAETLKKQTQLQLAKSIMQIKSATGQGIDFNNPVIDLTAIATWQNNAIKQFATEQEEAVKARNITQINGIGQFRSSHTLTVEPSKQLSAAQTTDLQTIHFEYAIIATDTVSTVSDEQVQAQLMYQDNRFWTPADARALETIPQKLLVIGDDPTALEMATIYHALGSNIDFVTTADQPFPELDKDINRYYQRSVKEQAKVCQNAFNIKLKTVVAAVSTRNAPDQDGGFYVSFSTKGKVTDPILYDAVLNATGLQPATETLNLKKIGIKTNEQGFICVEEQIKTNVAHIYAAGSVTCAQPSSCQDLANSVAQRRYQGRLAAETIANHYQPLSGQTPITPCSVSYTVPTVAWVGDTEKTLQNKDQDHQCVSIPWRAMGRANTDACTGGLTKLIFDKNSDVLLGGAIVGNHADEMIAEIGLAVNKGFTAQDIADTIHAHPTLYESVALAAERYLGTATDVLNT